ncbi:hypothetical protein B6V73_17505 [Thioclava sp. JM3]|nr:hypothetical protein B6V73_17505 [Thioclava sp. JM3]
MPNPVKIGSTYYLRLHVPRDVVELARGKSAPVHVAEHTSFPKMTSHVKVSLRTKDRGEARRRFSEVLSDLEERWDALRQGTVKLSHRQTLALAGEVRSDFIRFLDENPGEVAMWDDVALADAQAVTGTANPLAVPTPHTRERDMEKRFGGLVDAALSRRALEVDEASRRKLIEQVAAAMQDVSRINIAKAQGDYSESDETTRYPEFNSPREPAKRSVEAEPRTTLSDTIAREVERRASGQQSKPLPDKSVDKYQKVARNFVAFRGNELVATITAREADKWQQYLLASGKLSNSSVRQRLQNLRSIVEWARKQSFGELFPQGNPLDLVQLTERNGVSSEDRTLRMDEAKSILQAARLEGKPELRWLPWLCAYSGARVEEVAQLTPSDFFQYEGDWFYRMTTKGGKSLKNAYGIRRVPVDPLLIEEGLMRFTASHQSRHKERLFVKRAGQNVSDWVRNTVGLDRDELAPNHGWRHLFEDVAMSAGVSDSAKTYITGRATGRSAESYGKSDVMLPGLAREIRKVPSLLQARHSTSAER